MLVAMDLAVWNGRKEIVALLTTAFKTVGDLGTEWSFNPLSLPLTYNTRSRRYWRNQGPAGDH